MGPKSSFFITFNHLDEVIHILQIDFRIDASLLGSIKEVSDQWKRIPILLSDLVETSEVYTKSEGVIPFLDKQHRCAVR